MPENHLESVIKFSFPLSFPAGVRVFLFLWVDLKFHFTHFYWDFFFHIWFVWTSFVFLCYKVFLFHWTFQKVFHLLVLSLVFQNVLFDLLDKKRNENSWTPVGLIMNETLSNASFEFVLGLCYENKNQFMERNELSMRYFQWWVVILSKFIWFLVSNS
jgi:hypothetical protein